MLTNFDAVLAQYDMILPHAKAMVDQYVEKATVFRLVEGQNPTVALEEAQIIAIKYEDL